MYNIVVVDDEKIVRDGITSYFMDGKLGFKVIRSFADGKDAYEYIKENRDEIHVLLTDITMPIMSGLELLKKLREETIDVEIILLTGYKDFEYAQTAVKYGAYRYLLKPVRFSELDEIFGELCEKLDRKIMKCFSDDIEGRRQLLINQFLIELYCGFFSNEKTMNGRMEQLKIESGFLKRPCVVADFFRDVGKAVEEDKWKYNEERFDVAILNSIRCKNVEYYILCSNKDFLQIIAVPNYETESECFFSEIKEYIENGIGTLKQIFSIDVEVNKIQDFDKIKNILYFCFSGERYEMPEFINGEVDNSVILRAIDFIKENYKKNIYISDVAEYVGLNQVYFGRLFKICTGENFTDYLIKLRIETAMKLLEEGNMKISEVSVSVGYDNIKYFSRIFKRHTGKTPKAYKNERL